MTSSLYARSRRLAAATVTVIVVAGCASTGGLKPQASGRDPNRL